MCNRPASGTSNRFEPAVRFNSVKPETKIYAVNSSGLNKCKLPITDQRNICFPVTEFYIFTELPYTIDKFFVNGTEMYLFTRILFID